MSASISTISPSSPSTATENARPSDISRHLADDEISGVRHRPIRTPITSIRTAAQLCFCPASQIAARRRRRRAFCAVTACARPPKPSPVRVLTSTNTTVSVVGSTAITSSSPYRQRQLRVTIRSPRPVRCSAANRSPSAPISARVNIVMPVTLRERTDAGYPLRGDRPRNDAWLSPVAWSSTIALRASLTWS